MERLRALVDGASPIPAATENQRKQNEVLAEVERALLAELDSTRFLHLLVESASRRFDALTGVWLIAGDDVLVDHLTYAVEGCGPPLVNIATDKLR